MAIEKRSKHIDSLLSGEGECEWDERIERPPVIDPDRARELYANAVGPVPGRSSRGELLRKYLGGDELLIPEALPETWNDISVRSVFSADAAKAFPE